jgi:two-component system, OmpR family, phosphate regulon response regulator PhoB
MTNQGLPHDPAPHFPQPARILIVDDESIIAETIELALIEEGYDVTVMHNGRDALSLLLQNNTLQNNTPDNPSSIGEYNLPFVSRKFDLVILDLMLPGINGLDICRIIRQKGLDVLILILSARSSETDRVVGLEVGADDYLVKPFGMRELIARSRALLRRQPKSSTPAEGAIETDSREKPFTFQELTLYAQECRFIVGEKEVMLSPKEFRLLEVFMRFPKRVWSRDQLLEQVWGDDFIGESKTVDVHIRWLREKIELDPSDPQYLITVRGFGYRLGK